MLKLCILFIHRCMLLCCDSANHQPVQHNEECMPKNFWNGTYLLITSTTNNVEHWQQSSQVNARSPIECRSPWHAGFVCLFFHAGLQVFRSGEQTCMRATVTCRDWSWVGAYRGCEMNGAASGNAIFPRAINGRIRRAGSRARGAGGILPLARSGAGKWIQQGSLLQDVLSIEGVSHCCVPNRTFTLLLVSSMIASLASNWTVWTRKIIRWPVASGQWPVTK